MRKTLAKSPSILTNRTSTSTDFLVSKMPSSSPYLLDTHSNLKVFGISGPCYFSSKKICWDLISFKLGLSSKEGRTCQLIKPDFDISMKVRINNPHFRSVNRLMKVNQDTTLALVPTIPSFIASILQLHLHLMKVPCTRFL